MALNITNSTANTLITGTAENDSIINLGDNVTLNIVKEIRAINAIAGLTAGYDLSLSNLTESYLPVLPSYLDEVTFTTDGRKGTLQLDSATNMTVNGDNEFNANFDSNGNVASVSGFEGTLSSESFITINDTYTTYYVYNAGLEAYKAATVDNNDVYYDNSDSDITLTLTGNEIVIIGDDATGDKVVTAGNSRATLENYSTTANVTLKGGTNNDYIVAAGGENEIIDLSSGGKDTILAVDGASVEGYSAATGAMFQTDTETKENIINAIMNGDLYVNSDYFGPSRDKRVNLIDYDYSKGTFAKFRTLNGDEQLFAWSPQSGGIVDGSDYSENQIIFGIAPDGGSTLTGGTGDDTLYVSDSDLVNISGGNDSIVIDHINYPRNVNNGTVVDFGSAALLGNTTITGFNNSFINDSDYLVLENRSNLSMNFVNGKLQLTNGSSNLLFSDINDTANFIINTEGNRTRYNFLKDNSIVNVDNDYGPSTEFYGTPKADNLGKLDNDTGVDFTNYDETLFVNVGDTVTANQNHFYDIESITGGRNDSTLIGSDDYNVLIAGAGETSIFGAGGRDSLFGYDGSDVEKRGSTTFFVTNASDIDTIANFAFGVDETSDKLNTYGSDVLNSYFDGTALHINLGGGEAVINNAKNQILQLNVSGQDKIVEFGSDLTYNDSIEVYGDANNEHNSISVSSSLESDSVEIYANGFDGKIYLNVDKINASNSDKIATLVGGAESDSITASKGNSSLWGGESGNDTLVGGSSADEFFYLKGNGKDYISGATSDDVINLMNITLDDIKSTSIERNSLIVNFNDDGKLSIGGNANVVFQLADGSQWQVDRTKKNFTAK